ncbi:sugar ABC transporter substrate-binding protein [Azotobacter chroococcum]|nr:sugar ABC transporter substrate-binding protein [Azotobacter chroococcum]
MKRSPLCRFLAVVSLFLGLLSASLARAEPLQFAVVAKRVDHRYFILIGEGCAEAARAQGDTCLLLGPPGPAHFRLQNAVLEQALARNLDGIALSVTHSKWLADHALKRLGQTPLITFDSDLEPAERHLRRGFVGLDSLAFGQRLGTLAQRFRPQGGRLCILSAGGPHDISYQEHLKGIRQQLGGVPSHEGADRLSGGNGWSEPDRCPVFGADTQQKALFQLTTLLSSGSEVDTIISLSPWLVYRADLYRRQLGPLLAELDKKGAQPAIIIITPEPDDAARRALLDEGLVQAYLSTESREIGRQIYRTLRRLAQGEPVSEKVLVGSRAYLPQSLPDIPAKR